MTLVFIFLSPSFQSLFSGRPAYTHNILIVYVGIYVYTWASLEAETVKNLPAMQETWVRSLGWEDPLGKGMANHSSILAWRIPWTEEPGRLQSMGLQRI